MTSSRSSAQILALLMQKPSSPHQQRYPSNTATMNAARSTLEASQDVIAAEISSETINAMMDKGDTAAAFAHVYESLPVTEQICLGMKGNFDSKKMRYPVLELYLLYYEIRKAVRHTASVKILQIESALRAAAASAAAVAFDEQAFAYLREHDFVDVYPASGLKVLIGVSQLEDLLPFGSLKRFRSVLEEAKGLKAAVVVEISLLRAEKDEETGRIDVVEVVKVLPLSANMEKEVALSLKDFGESRVWGGEEGGKGKEMRSILLADTYLKIREIKKWFDGTMRDVEKRWIGPVASAQGQQLSAQLSDSASTSSPPAATPSREAKFKENQVDSFTNQLTAKYQTPVKVIEVSSEPVSPVSTSEESEFSLSDIKGGPAFFVRELVGAEDGSDD